MCKVGKVMLLNEEKTAGNSRDLSATGNRKYVARIGYMSGRLFVKASLLKFMVVSVLATAEF